LLTLGLGRVAFVSEYGLVDTSDANDIIVRRNLLVYLGLRLHVTGGGAAACPSGTFTLQLPLGSGPAGFQWRRNNADLSDGPTGTGAVISGATTRVVMIANAQPNDSGTFDCHVAIPCNSIVSDSAPVNVYAVGTGDTNFDGQVDGIDIQGFVR